jgi:hypothetical protein
VTFDITDDITETAEALAENVAGQLPRTSGGPDLRGSLSPNPRTSSPDVWKKTTEKRKSSSRSKGSSDKRKRTERIADCDKEQDTCLNSDDFPSEDRPEMFQNDTKFNKLSYETAAKICWEFKQLNEKKLLKERKNNSTLEKADDKLPIVKIPAGEDDARSLFCSARKLLRPPVVEMSKMMDWYPTKWEQIVRNLPLDIYSLDDSVNSRSVELCHNL